jgi:hypothetical protein
MEEQDDEGRSADLRAPSGGRNSPSHGNFNDTCEVEEDTEGGEKATSKGKGMQNGNGKGKVTEDGKGKVKGKGKENRKWKCIGKQTTGGDEIYCAVVLQLQQETYEGDLDTEG